MINLHSLDSSHLFNLQVVLMLLKHYLFFKKVYSSNCYLFHLQHLLLRLLALILHNQMLNKVQQHKNRLSHNRRDLQRSPFKKLPKLKTIKAAVKQNSALHKMKKNQYHLKHHLRCQLQQEVMMALNLRFLLEMWQWLKLRLVSLIKVLRRFLTLLLNECFCFYNINI